MFIFLAIVGLSVLVFFHELGHFLIAKITGIRVEEFGLGFPPRICGIIFKGKSKLKFFWGKNKPEESKTKTIYSANWILFGGFNKLKGELGGDKSKDSFFTQVWWKKALVGLGGSALNIILAVFIFAFLYFTGIPQDTDLIEQNATVVRSIGIQIAMIVPDSPAHDAGLKMGDVIIGIDDYAFDSVEQIQNHISTKVGQSIVIKVKRANEVTFQKVEVVPYSEVFSVYDESSPTNNNKIEGVLENEERGVIGIALSQSAIVTYPIHQAVILGVKSTFLLLNRLLYGLVLIFKTLITKQQMLGDFFGPVGITVMTAEIAQLGYVYLLQFIAFLSVAIGVFQMIPFPALDGSRVLFAFIEGVKGRPIDHQTESLIITIGFYLLLGLLIFITSKELLSLF